MFDTLSLNKACKEQHEMVIAKGFEPQPIATNLMLIVSELGEACEADRKNRHADIQSWNDEAPITCKSIADDEILYRKPDGHLIDKETAHKICERAFKKNIKDTFEDEIADAFLRLMDLCGEYDIDIEWHIKSKAAYNLTRPIKHGKAY